MFGVEALVRLLARGLLLALAAVLRAIDQFPPPRGRPAGGVGSGFLGPVVPSRSERRMLPEGEAGVWAVRLVSLLDPWMSRAEARRLRAVAGRMLRAVEARPDWRGLGSALPAAADALAGG